MLGNCGKPVSSYPPFVGAMGSGQSPPMYSMCRYVVHAWDGNLQDMVDALLEELTPKSLTPGAFTQPNLKAGVMVWIGGLHASAWIVGTAFALCSLFVLVNLLNLVQLTTVVREESHQNQNCFTGLSLPTTCNNQCPIPPPYRSLCTGPRRGSQQGPFLSHRSHGAGSGRMWSRCGMMIHLLSPEQKPIHAAG